MKKLKKAISVTVLSAVVMIFLSLSALAVTDIKVINDRNGAVTVTAEGAERFAVTQYDRLGFIKAIGISSLVGDIQSATIPYDSTTTVKIMGFSNWESLTPDAKAHTVGKRTLARVDFSGVMESDYTIEDCDRYEIVNNYTTPDRDGNDTKALLMTGSYGDNEVFDVQFGGTHSPDTDCVVFEYDLKLNSVVTEFSTYIKSVKTDGSAGVWQKLWAVEQYNINTARISFGGNGISPCELNADRWYRISAVADYNLMTVKFYVDNEYVAQEQMADGVCDAQNKPDVFCIKGPEKGEANFVVDNVHVYEGTHPRDDIELFRIDVEGVNHSVVAHSETTARNTFSGKYLIHTRNGVATDANGNKTLLKNLPVRKDGVNYVHLEEICKAWGIEVLTGVSKDRNGYAKLTDVARVMNKNIYTLDAAKNSGLVILADSFNTPSGDTAQGLNDYAFYLRPTATDILETYDRSANKGVHPRLLATQSDFDRIREMYLDGTDASFMAWATELISYADNRLGHVLPTYTELFGAGRAVPRNLKGDVYSWAMAYHLTKDDKYVDAVIREFTHISAYPTWYPEDHLHIVEIMDAYAIGYDWLYNQFTPDERKAIEESIYIKSFTESYAAYIDKSAPMKHAFYAQNNHGTVCNGGVTMAALALMDVYPEECAWLIEGAIKGNEFNIDKWHTGAWYEGAAYWEYALAYTVKFIEGMRCVLGTDFGFGDLEGLDLAAEKEIGMHGCAGIFNYGDGGNVKCYSPEIMWLGDEFNNPSVSTKVVKEYTPASFPLSHRRHGEPLALALLWYNPDMILDDVTFPKDYFYEDLDVITMREGWDDEDTFVGVKGGKLILDHSQLDAGTFVFESDGVRWMHELGAGRYDSGYFDSSSGGARWEFVEARAEGHSTVSVNPGQKEDMNVALNGATADVTYVDANDSGAITTVDMTQVLFNVKDATRGFFLTDNRQSLVLRDEIELASLPVDETFDGLTETNVFGTLESNYELISGAPYGLSATDTVARLTGINRYFNNHAWNANAGSQKAIFEYDFYAEDAGTSFRFYPVGTNRYGMQISDGILYAMLPSWTTASTGVSVSAKQWHHFKIEYDMANGQMLIYMDNSLVHTQTGLDTSANAPVDHYFTLQKGVNGKGVLINNLKCYTKTPQNLTDVVYWRLITNTDAEVTIDSNTKTITMTKDGKGCTVTYAVEGGEIVEAKYESPIESILNDARPLRLDADRVQIKITNISGSVTITAKITPDTAVNPTPLSDYMKPISEWTLD